MKITPIQYAKALLELTEKKSESEISAIVFKFALELRKTGQLKNSNAIMEKFSKLWNVANGVVEAEILSARK